MITTPRAVRRARRAWPCAAALACLLAVACDDRVRGPAAPSPSPPPPAPPPTIDLGEERYLLQIAGGDVTAALPACSPALVPRAGKFVTTFVWFTRSGEELVGRSRPPYLATLEIRLRAVSTSVLGTTVAGTVAGAAPDEYDGIWGRRDSTFAVESQATVDGTMAPRSVLDTSGGRLGGTWRGAMRFHDSTGAASLCTAVQYYLEPAPPGGRHDDPSVPPVVVEAAPRR